MIPPSSLLAIAELRAQGYLTLRELATRWGEEYPNVRSMRARGALAGAILGPDGRRWFVPAGSPRPEPKYRCGRPRAATKRAAAYQSVVRPPPVSLAPEWARWAVFGGQPETVMDLGWLGGMGSSRPAPTDVPIGVGAEAGLLEGSPPAEPFQFIPARVAGHD